MVAAGVNRIILNLTDQTIASPIEIQAVSQSALPSERQLIPIGNQSSHQYNYY